LARPESTRGLRRRISTPPTPGGEQPSTCPPFGSGYEKRKGARLGRRETRPHSRCLLRTRLPPRYPQAPPLHSAGITTRFTLWGHSHATPCSTNRIQFVLHPVAWACSTVEHAPRFSKRTPFHRYCRGVGFMLQMLQMIGNPLWTCVQNRTMMDGFDPPRKRGCEVFAFGSPFGPVHP